MILLYEIIEKSTHENPILEIQVQERVGEFQARTPTFKPGTGIGLHIHNIRQHFL